MPPNVDKSIKSCFPTLTVVVRKFQLVPRKVDGSGPRRERQKPLRLPQLPLLAVFEHVNSRQAEYNVEHKITPRALIKPLGAPSASNLEPRTPNPKPQTPNLIIKTKPGDSILDLVASSKKQKGDGSGGAEDADTPSRGRGGAHARAKGRAGDVPEQDPGIVQRHRNLRNFRLFRLGEILAI